MIDQREQNTSAAVQTDTEKLVQESRIVLNGNMSIW